MSATGQTDVLVPSCPSAPGRVAAFCRGRWCVEVNIDTPHLDRRHRAMIDLRRSGDAVRADTMGWVTLASIMLEVPTTSWRRLFTHPDPSAIVDQVATDLRLGLPSAALASEVRTDFGIIHSAGDARAWTLCAMVGSALDPTDPVRIIGGLPVSSAQVADEFRRALRSALGAASA